MYSGVSLTASALTAADMTAMAENGHHPLARRAKDGVGDQADRGGVEAAWAGMPAIWA